ncbi:Zinc ion binding protein isoform 1 [Hibiscus syriacus]|uniref:Zinc ion binding protein isoform 1 n=1 Tax=Hibiscus syriacus TaxID=106335 RepID=A0A6A3CNT0_HIBSY|nr:Zinc ion binding protein isoform 1 [Hibiscus syriacus]
MEGKRVEIGQIRKGPWKAEEDEVLMNHVMKYGPRDWSSIRSKVYGGEEREVIELQAQFGNKWAEIATYLSGRTDNDVKNFWSSRQKRLARILQNSGPPSSSSKSLKMEKEIPGFHVVPVMEAPKLSSSMEELSYSKNANMDQLELMSRGKNPYTETQSQVFIPQKPQPYLTLSLESQDLLAKFEDPYFSQVLAPPMDVPELDSGNVEQPFSGFSAKEETDNPMTPDAFFHDFPADMFDQMEPLPSPSE